MGAQISPSVQRIIFSVRLNSLLKTRLIEIRPDRTVESATGSAVGTTGCVRAGLL
jgi:hypothetical protein